MICPTFIPSIVELSPVVTSSKNTFAQNNFCLLCIIIMTMSNTFIGLPLHFLVILYRIIIMLLHNSCNTQFQQNVHYIFLLTSKVLIGNTISIISDILKSITKHISRFYILRFCYSTELLC